MFPHWMRWGTTLLTNLALDPLLREWVQHEPIARSVGATDEMINALGRDDIEADCFSTELRLVLRFTTEVVRDVRHSDETATALEGFSPREVIELLMAIGQYMMVARVAAATEVELDEPMGTDVFGPTG